jgi:xylulose-5-phosphate/fructose-6-phosphate phosphoketolase
MAITKKRTKTVKRLVRPVVSKNSSSFLSSEELSWFKDYHAYTNYIGASMLYLKDNFVLRRKLTKNDIKDRILGHWGTVPGLNFIYAHASFLTNKHKQKAMFITGPGHGAPAILANIYADGSLSDFYKEMSRDEKGLGHLLKGFSWPYKFPSHVTPDVPGSILEGGELGYSLATAFGAVMDNKDLMVVCVVGDGEAESGPLAAAWHSNKFLNPAESGAVLPIIHVNGYKISGPSIYSTMSDEELTNLFKGYGYKPYFVEDQEEMLHEDMAKNLEMAYSDIKEIWRKAREENVVMKSAWPVIIFRSMKGWTGTERLGGKKIEDNYRAHGIPLSDPKGDPIQFKALSDWLESYRFKDLVDSKGRPLPKITKYLPKGDLRMAKCRHAYGGEIVKDLPALKPEKYEFNGDHGEVMGQSTKLATEWLNQVFVLDRKKNKTLRYFCPDETESNKMGRLFEGAGREYVWPVKKEDEYIVTSGRVIEMLSEHTLMGHLLGYLLTGRQGMFATYEAFSMVNVSMVDQHCKFIKQARRLKWRKPIASLNYLLTSNCWRQEHNGFSHQNVGFISNALEKHGDFVSVYFPPDANSLMVTWEGNFQSRNKVNVVVAGKTDLPQWLSVKEARQQMETGVMTWGWIDPDGSKDPDIILAAAGDYMIEEVVAAVDILRHEIPEFKTRFVCVSEMTAHGLGAVKKPLNEKNVLEFEKYFGKTQPILFNFHGYAITVKKLLFGHPHAGRFTISGYSEEGSTTTPFDMQCRNGTSRFHLVIAAMEKAGLNNKKYARKAKELIKKYQKKLQENRKYVEKNGVDLAEVVHWKWDN